MHITLPENITINAPAEKVWQVVAHDFGQIGRWATAIAMSEADMTGAKPDGATCNGRICTAPNFGDVHETFTYYDEADMRYGYLATRGLPFFIEHAENNWSVEALSPTQTKVEFRGEVDLKPFLGIIFAPLFKWQMSRIGAQLAEELKYYIEEGEPHPRKQKQLAKMLVHA